MELEGMGINHHHSPTGNKPPEDRNSPEYLATLLKDKKQLAAFPNVFAHLDRILDEEINKVRIALFHINTNKEPMVLPEHLGAIVTLSEKLFVPVKEHPDFNFVGRILGPRGMTAKQLEQDTGCKIMVRGKGSMRDKMKEELNRGKPNWEHLNEELHVLITVEDSRNRAELKLQRAVEEVRKLLVPAPEGEDELKKMQLMELAIINGTYRDSKAMMTAVAHMPRVLGPPLNLPPQMRSPQPQGAPIILAPRGMSMSMSQMLNGGPPPLISPTEAGLIYPYEFPYGMAPQLLEYPGGLDHTAVGTSYVR